MECAGCSILLYERRTLGILPDPLSGPARGRAGRGKVCTGASTVVRLMVEDQMVSELEAAEAHLCTACAAAYAERRAAEGCAQCGDRLRCPVAGCDPSLMDALQTFCQSCQITQLVQGSRDATEAAVAAATAACEEMVEAAHARTEALQGALDDLIESTQHQVPQQRGAPKGPDDGSSIPFNCGSEAVHNGSFKSTKLPQARRDAKGRYLNMPYFS